MTDHARYSRGLWRRTLCVVALSWLATGCAVLTPGQVEAVRDFSIAVDGYGELPRVAIDSHAEIRVENALLDATLSGERSAERLVAAVDAAQQLRAQAVRADAAVDALDVYAALLLQLTSEKYSKKVDEEAIGLGKSFDALAQSAGVSGSIGDAVAIGTSALGRIWLRRKQSIALQKSVGAAGPIIAKLTAKVEGLMDLYLGPASNPSLGLLERELDTLKTTMVNIAASFPRAIPPELVQHEVDAVERIRETQDLARRARTAAGIYRDVHAELVSGTRKKAGVKGWIDQIRVLAGEVKAARRVKARVGN